MGLAVGFVREIFVDCIVYNGRSVGGGGRETLLHFVLHICGLESDPENGDY